MNFDFAPTQFNIIVDNRLVGYLEEYEYRNWDSDNGWVKVWKLYSNEWDELATFDNLGEATKNLHALEEYLANNPEWLDP